MTKIILTTSLLASACLVNGQEVQWASFNPTPGATSFGADWQTGGSFDVTYAGDAYVAPGYPFGPDFSLTKISGAGDAILDPVSMLSMFNASTPWTVTFNNFSGTTIDSNTLLVVGNLDVLLDATVSISASLAGTAVSTSGWSLVSQYEFTNFDDDGAPIAWDAGTSTLSTSASSNPAEDQSGFAFLKADGAFDEVVFSYSSSSTTANEFIKFGIGQQAVPEPSSVGLLCLSALGLLARRKR